MWPNVVTHFKSELFLDHALGVIQWTAHQKMTKRGFKYSNMWASCKQFHSIMATVWQQRANEDSMHQLAYILKLLKKLLKELHRSMFPDILKQVEEVRLELENVQLRLICDPGSEELFYLEKQIAQRYKLLTQAAHAYKVQVSKTTWLSFGDDNTRYFHSLVRQQKYHKLIV